MLNFDINLDIGEQDDQNFIKTLKKFKETKEEVNK